MSIYKLILILVFVIALLYHLKGKKSLPIFFPFISIVIFFEIFCEYCYYRFYGNNILILNIYSRLCIYYYLFIYLEYFKEKSWKQFLKYLIFIYVMVSLVIFIYSIKKTKVDILNYNLGMTIILPLILFYLYDIIYNKSHFNILKDPYFYFSFGILLFYTSAFPLLGFINLLIKDHTHFLLILPPQLLLHSLLYLLLFL